MIVSFGETTKELKIIYFSKIICCDSIHDYYYAMCVCVWVCAVHKTDKTKLFFTLINGKKYAATIYPIYFGQIK